MNAKADLALVLNAYIDDLITRHMEHGVQTGTVDNTVMEALVALIDERIEKSKMIHPTRNGKPL
jgi:hypothetical protein